MMKNEYQLRHNSRWKERNSLAEFTPEELRKCEKIALLDYAINSEEIPTNPNVKTGYNTSKDSDEFDLYVNFLKFADPMNYYEYFRQGEDLKKEMANRLLFYSYTK